MKNKNEIRQYQLTALNYLPLLISMILIPIIIGCLALGYSQYGLLSDFSMMGNANDNPALAVAGVSTVMTIISLSVTMVVTISSFICGRLYDFNFFAVINGILVYVSTAFEITYAVGANLASSDGRYFLSLNYIPVVLSLLLSVSYTVLYILFVYRPVKKIKQMVLEEEKKQIELKEQIHSEISGMNREELFRYIKGKYQEGSISKEEYEKLLKELAD